MSIAVLINWCANFLVGIGFPTMQVKIKAKQKSNAVCSRYSSEVVFLLDNFGELHVLAVQCVSGYFLDFHLQESPRDQKQDF